MLTVEKLIKISKSTGLKIVTTHDRVRQSQVIVVDRVEARDLLRANRVQVPPCFLTIQPYP